MQSRTQSTVQINLQCVVSLFLLQNPFTSTIWIALYSHCVQICFIQLPTSPKKGSTMLCCEYQVYIYSGYLPLLVSILGINCYLKLILIQLSLSSTGLIVGAIIRYAGKTNQVTYLDAHPAPNTKYNLSVPPDILRFHFPEKIQINSGGQQLDFIFYKIYSSRTLKLSVK